MLIPLASLAVVVVIMLFEQQVSLRHERTLREAGAIEPAGDVFATMRWAYPGVFVVMAIEGAVTGASPGIATLAGAAILIASKALKAWAVTSLGERWTFRVLVLPGAPLVTAGPYALMRHPNYVAVVGELVGMALLVGARFTGPVAILLFALLLRARMKVENRALRYPTCS